MSEDTVCQMAIGVRTAMATSWSIATSGIAGPDGGTAEKPVGTVWIAVAGPSGTEARCFHFKGGRRQIMEQTAVAALVMLWYKLKKEE